MPVTGVKQSSSENDIKVFKSQREGGGTMGRDPVSSSVAGTSSSMFELKSDIPQVYLNDQPLDVECTEARDCDESRSRSHDSEGERYEETEIKGQEEHAGECHMDKDDTSFEVIDKQDDQEAKHQQDDLDPTLGVSVDDLDGSYNCFAGSEIISGALSSSTDDVFASSRDDIECDRVSHDQFLLASLSGSDEGILMMGSSAEDLLDREDEEEGEEEQEDDFPSDDGRDSERYLST